MKSAGKENLRWNKFMENKHNEHKFALDLAVLQSLSGGVSLSYK